MKKQLPKKFKYEEYSKDFINAAQSAVEDHTAKNIREVAEAIGWTEAGMSSVKSGAINVPLKYVKAFEEIYKIPILTSIESKDIQSRLLRIEATLEVVEVSIAGLKAQKTGDFDKRFDELQTLIAAAVKRRKGL